MPISQLPDMTRLQKETNCGFKHFFNYHLNQRQNSSTPLGELTRTSSGITLLRSPKLEGLLSALECNMLGPIPQYPPTWKCQKKVSTKMDNLNKTAVILPPNLMTVKMAMTKATIECSTTSTTASAHAAPD